MLKLDYRFNFNCSSLSWNKFIFKMKKNSANVIGKISQSDYMSEDINIFRSNQLTSLELRSNIIVLINILKATSKICQWLSSHLSVRIFKISSITYGNSHNLISKFFIHSVWSYFSWRLSAKWNQKQLLRFSFKNYLFPV